MPSDKEVFGGVATWEPCRLVQKDARCFNLFTSDVYMFLGNHALSTALPLDSNQHARTEQVFKENFLINVGHVLRGVCQEMQKVTDLTNMVLDTRCSKAVLYLLDLILKHVECFNQRIISLSYIPTAMKTLLEKFHAPEVIAKSKDVINRIKVVREAKVQQGRWRAQ